MAALYVRKLIFMRDHESLGFLVKLLLSWCFCGTTIFEKHVLTLFVAAMFMACLMAWSSPDRTQVNFLRTDSNGWHCLKSCLPLGTTFFEGTGMHKMGTYRISRVRGPVVSDSIASGFCHCLQLSDKVVLRNIREKWLLICDGER